MVRDRTSPPPPYSLPLPLPRLPTHFHFHSHSPPAQAQTHYVSHPPDAIPTAMGSVSVEEDVMGKLGAAAANFQVDRTVARSIAALLKQAVESGHTFYTAKCFLRQLKSSKRTSIVLTPCAIADKMTAAYIAVAVFQSQSREMDQTYALELARECACILTLNIVYDRGPNARLIYSVPRSSEFARKCKTSSPQQRVGVVDEVSISRPHTYDCELCAGCGKKGGLGPGEQLQTCSRCNIVRYCSKECQVSDWKKHKEHCKKRLAGERSVLTKERPSMLFTSSREMMEEHKRNGATVIDLDSLSL